MPNSELVQSVLRALDMLSAVAASSNGLRLNDVAQATGVKVTTAHNLLRTLAARGYVYKDANGSYFLGSAVYELAQKNDRQEIVVRAAAALPRVAELLPEAVLTFSYLTPDAARCILRMSPDRPMEVQRPLELLFQPYISATAICLQATAPNALQYERHWRFEECGVGCWKSLEEFMAVKNRVRLDGHYIHLDQGKVASAFAVADNYALGISLFVQDNDLSAVFQAADAFCTLMR